MSQSIIIYNFNYYNIIILNRFNSIYPKKFNFENVLEKCLTIHDLILLKLKKSIPFLLLLLNPLQLFWTRINICLNAKYNVKLLAPMCSDKLGQQNKID